MNLVVGIGIFVGALLSYTMVGVYRWLRTCGTCPICLSEYERRAG